MPATILAVDLGRYKSVARAYDRRPRSRTFRATDTTPAEVVELRARCPGSPRDGHRPSHAVAYATVGHVRTSAPSSLTRGRACHASIPSTAVRSAPVTRYNASRASNRGSGGLRPRIRREVIGGRYVIACHFAKKVCSNAAEGHYNGDGRGGPPMESERVRSAVRHLHALGVAPAATLGDAELLRRFTDTRDEAAFAVLAERHGPMVLRVCRRALGHAQDAEDACQATFLILARKAASIRHRGSVASWLYGVAARTARKLRAGRARREVGGACPEESTPTAAGDDPSWREALAILEDELFRLPAKYREPLALCFLEGLTRDEAARRLGLGANPFRGRLDYGRELLRGRLTRRGVTLPAGLLAGLVAGQARATVPAGLVVSTAKAAGLTAAGQALPAGLIPARVAALADGVRQTMRTLKLKLVTAGLLLAALGAGLSAARPDARPDNSRPSKAVPATTASTDPPPVAGVTKGFQTTTTDRAEAVTFSPDGRLLAGGGWDQKVRLWDVRDKKLVRTLDEADGAVGDVRFSPDGKTLAVGAADGLVSLWPVATGTRESVLEAKLPRKAGESVSVHGLQFLPGGRLAVAYYYQDAARDERHMQILLWDVRGREPVVLFRQEGCTFGLAASPDGKLLAAALTGEFAGVRVWDLDRRKVVMEDKAGGDGHAAVAFDGTGTKLAVGGYHVIEKRGGFSAEGRLWLYDVKTGKELWAVKEPTNGSYSHIAFTPDGRGILTGSNGPVRDFRANGAQGQKLVSELRRWDSATGRLVWRAEGEFGHFRIAASGDGQLAGSDDEELRLFDPATGKPGDVLAKWRR